MECIARLDKEGLEEATGITALIRDKPAYDPLELYSM